MSDLGEQYPQQGLGEEDSYDDKQQPTIKHLMYDFIDDDFSDDSDDYADDNDDNEDEASASINWCDKTGKKMTKDEFWKIHKSKYKAHRAEYDLLYDGISLSTIESQSSCTDTCSEADTASSYSGRDDVDDTNVLISFYDGADDTLYEKNFMAVAIPRVIIPEPSPVAVTTPQSSPAAAAQKNDDAASCCFPCGGLWSRFLRAVGFRRGRVN